MEVQEIKKYLVLILFLLSLNFLSLNFGAYSPVYLRNIGLLFSIIALLIAFSYSSFGKEEIGKRNIFWGTIFIILSVIILFVLPTKEFWILFLPIFIFGVFGLSKKIEKELSLIAIGSLFYLITFLLYEHIPILNRSISTLSISLTQILGNIISRPMQLGSTPSGFWILLSFVLCCLAAFILNRNSLRFFLFLISSIALWIVSLLLYNFFFSFDTIIIYQFTLLLLLIVPFFIYIRKIGIRIKPIRWEKISTIVLAILIAASAIFLTILPYSNSGNPGKVVIYEKNCTMGFDLPEYPKENEVLQPYRGLSIGAMPCYLEKLGYEIEHLTPEKLKTLEESLADADVFVVINLNESFSLNERNSIRKFVKNGGGLLIFGEHTNMFVDDAEFQSGHHYLNDILEFTGIRINSDTADWPRGYWAKPLEVLPHPVTKGLSEIELRTSSVGASLKLSGSARPIIIGKYGFADNPDPFFPGYLGNREYELDEQLGDIVIVASDEYGDGDGKVLVFGDTSYVFNNAIPSKWKLVKNSFNYLMGEHNNLIVYLNVIGAIILAILLIISVLIFRGKLHIYAILSLVIVLSMVSSSAISSSLVTSPEIEKSDIAWIDHAHFNKFNMVSYEDDGLEGVYINLMRNEYLPLIMDDFSLLDKGKILIIIAPTESYSRRKVKKIENWVKNGGVLFLSAGYSERDEVKQILDVFRADIKDIPLGSVPWIVETHGGESTVSQEDLEKYWHKPKFMEAYPVSGDDYKSYVSINYSGEVYDLMIGKRYGKGAFILVGDSRFFYSQNIEQALDSTESKDQYLLQWVGNIELLKEIFTELREEGVL